MIPIKKLHKKILKFFKNHYRYILVVSVIIATFIGYMHFELENNGDELEKLEESLKIFGEMDGLIILPLVLIVTILMLIFLIAINVDSMRFRDELSRLELRKLYADFLFIQLITRIEEIEKKHLHNKDIIPIENWIQAHEDLRKVIDKFRKDTKKLLKMLESEVLAPPEVVFADEEIQNSRFANLTIEDNFVNELAAS